MQTVKDIAKAVADIPELLKEVYGDLAKPGVTQAGKALATVIGLGNTMLWPIALMNEKAKIALEENLDRYREKMAQIPEADISEVPPEVGVPIAEKLLYVSNEQLRELYVELLATASSKKTNANAHPSFVNVIDNLSPDEGLLIQEMRKSSGYPFIEVRMHEAGKKEWITLAKIVTSFGSGVKLRFPHNLSTYISNLEGLGLLRARQDIYMGGEGLYEPLEKTALEHFGHIEKEVESRSIRFQRGKIEVTPYGHLFSVACTGDA